MKQKLKQIVAISVLLAATKCTKFVFGWGSAPDPAGGAHDAPPDSLVSWGWGHPFPFPSHASILTPSAFASALRFQRSATSFFTV